MITLELNLSKHFIKDADNREELNSTVKRLEPEAILLRVPDIEDVREEKTEIEEGWAEVMKELGAYSEENGVPLYYVSSATEGPISLIHGADLFTTRPTKAGELIERDFQLPSKDMRRLWKENPYLTSGKIRQYYGKRKLWEREEFAEEVDKEGEFPYPFTVHRYRPKDVHKMTDRNYRELAKIISSKVYGEEVKEIREAIENDEVDKVKSKYREWMQDISLFP